MHLEDAAGGRADRIGVVGKPDPVGGADLAQPGAGRCDQVGQPEPIADLDQLAAADDDLAAGGERRRREQHGRRAVVDDQRVLGGRNRCSQRREGAASARRPPTGSKVELDVDVAGCCFHGPQRRIGQWGPAEVGVQDDAGRVDHLVEGRRRLRQSGHGGIGDLGGIQHSLARLLLRGGDRLLDRRSTQPGHGFGQPGVAEDDVCPGNAPARIRRHHPPPLAPSRGGGRESNPPSRAARLHRF